MEFTYYYADQTEQFQFVMIPRALISGKEFEELSYAAKLIYGLLRDKISLSRKNGWVDEENRVYIIYTVKQIMEEMSLSEKLAIKYMKELETFGLIEKKRRGLGQPNLIYVKNFAGFALKEKHPDDEKGAENKGFSRPSQMGSSRPSQMGSSDLPEWEAQDLPEPTDNNINKYTNTELNHILSFHTPVAMEQAPGIKAEDEIRHKHFWIEHVKTQIDYDFIVEENPYITDMVDNIVFLMAEVLSCKDDYMVIGKSQKPAMLVKENYLKIKKHHVEYVIEKLKSSGSQIGNIKQYVMTMLFNAAGTFDLYITAEVSKNMAAGF